jgi:hypothetical protein
MNDVKKVKTNRRGSQQTNRRGSQNQEKQSQPGGQNASSDPPRSRKARRRSIFGKAADNSDNQRQKQPQSRWINSVKLTQTISKLQKNKAADVLESDDPKGTKKRMRSTAIASRWMHSAKRAEGGDKAVTGTRGRKVLLANKAIKSMKKQKEALAKKGMSVRGPALMVGAAGAFRQQQSIRASPRRGSVFEGFEDEDLTLSNSLLLDGNASDRKANSGAGGANGGNSKDVPSAARGWCCGIGIIMPDTSFRLGNYDRIFNS